MKSHALNLGSSPGATARGSGRWEAARFTSLERPDSARFRLVSRSDGFSVLSPTSGGLQAKSKVPLMPRALVIPSVT